jgi:hypothetical protein
MWGRRLSANDPPAIEKRPGDKHPLYSIPFVDGS